MFSKCIHILQKQPQIDTPGASARRKLHYQSCFLEKTLLLGKALITEGYPGASGDARINIMHVYIKDFILKGVSDMDV